MIKTEGTWFLRLYRGDRLVDERSGKNVITTVGKQFLANFLASAAAGASTFTCRYVGIGTDSSTASIGQTALGAELARASAVVSSATAIYRCTATFPSGTGTGALTEFGLFSTSSAGTMFSRKVESVINKGANDELQATVEITLS